MNARRDAPTAEELATEANGLATGLGMLTMIYAPFALPGLLLALPLILPVIPLLLVAGIVYLLARILLLPVRLARTVWRRRSSRRAISAPEHPPPSRDRGRPTPRGIPVPRR